MRHCIHSLLAQPPREPGSPPPVLQRRQPTGSVCWGPPEADDRSAPIAKLLAAAEPEEVLDVGIWHPLAPNMYEDLKEFLNW